jgi:antirestriction protein ArdC
MIEPQSEALIAATGADFRIGVIKRASFCLPIDTLTPKGRLPA